MDVPQSAARTRVLHRLAEQLLAAAAATPHPLRAGIDGRSAAGKTSLADELVALLEQRGVHVVRVSIDGFHRPGHRRRSIRGEWTPELRLAEGLDYAAFRRFVLDPLGPGGSRRILARWFNSYLDEPYPEEWVAVPEDAILLSDAGHGFMPALRDLWDYRIWLEVDAATMVERAVARDPAWADPGTDIRHRYETFWTACDDLYHSRYAPSDAAHCVVDNGDLHHPRILRIEARPPAGGAALPPSTPTGES